MTKKLREVMLDLHMMQKPQLIFNIDEKGCRLSLHKTQMAPAQTDSKRTHLVGPAHGENVTIVSCGKVLGQVTPPMVLFKGKKCKPE
jgi:hypothetical protein